MKTSILLASIIILITFFDSKTLAQEKAWTVITTSHDTLQSCVIGKYEGYLLHITSSGNEKIIYIDSILTIFRNGETHPWRSAGYGALAGAGAGAFLGVATHKSSDDQFIDLGPGVAMLGGAIFGGITGFAIGGIIGLSSSGDESYDFSNIETVEKMRYIREIRNEYSNE